MNEQLLDPSIICNNNVNSVPVYELVIKYRNVYRRPGQYLKYLYRSCSVCFRIKYRDVWHSNVQLQAS